MGTKKISCIVLSFIDLPSSTPPHSLKTYNKYENTLRQHTTLLFFTLFFPYLYSLFFIHYSPMETPSITYYLLPVLVLLHKMIGLLNEMTEFWGEAAAKQQHTCRFDSSPFILGVSGRDVYARFPQSLNLQRICWAFHNGSNGTLQASFSSGHDAFLTLRNQFWSGVSDCFQIWCAIWLSL